MTEHKNLRIKSDTFDVLQEHKEDWETWDGFMRRMVGEIDG